MRNRRPPSLAPLAFLLLLLPLPARAALSPVGAPLIIADESPFCSSTTTLEVIATPKGAFEAIWIDDGEGFEAKGRRFARNLQPTGPPQTLLPLHGGLILTGLFGTWTGRYELAMNGLDFGENPDDPAVAYRVPLNVEGEVVTPPLRIAPLRFVGLAPAAFGHSLQFRFEPPFFGPATCPSQGLLARRIAANGAPISAESRVNRRASAWGGFHLAVDRLPDDTFVVAYSTCEKFIGLVVRHLNAAGEPIGKPIDLTLPGQGLVGSVVGGNLALAARGAADFAVVAIAASSTLNTLGTYTRAVVNGQLFGPTLIDVPVGAVVDLAASPSGGYLLLFRRTSGDPPHPTLFAQELDAQGVPRNEPLAITEGSGDVNGVVASLPNGRWIVISRAQDGEFGSCSERLVGTVLTSE